MDKKCGDGCAEIEYLNKPFKYPKAEGELIAQPRCLMDLGKDPIQPNKLQVSLAFNSVVDQIIVCIALYSVLNLYCKSGHKTYCIVKT